MRNPTAALFVALVVSLVVLGGCGPGTSEPVAPPTATPTEVVLAVPDPAAARDAALVYIAANYSEYGPAPDLTWTEENVTPEGLVGSSTFEYTADGAPEGVRWTIAVAFPVVPPDATVYHVRVAEQSATLLWEGEVDAAGQVTELSVQTGPARGDFWPLDPIICDDLRDAMAQALGVEVTMAEAAFEDYGSGRAGIGCQMTALGTGLDFENMLVVANALREILQDRGWEEDTMYAADGPTGTASGFRQGNGLCLTSVRWEPAEDAVCPDDQPISACELEPEQRLYTVTLDCAQSAAVEE